MKIFLWGLMGAGKTSLAKNISHHIRGLRFFDLDLLIEGKTGRSISGIFSQEGEEAFRTIESQILRETIGTSDNFVLATGGGTPVFFDNAELMRASGLTIYLKASPEMLAQRLWPEKNKRPLIANAQSPADLRSILEGLLKKREPYYLQAHIIWDINRPAQELIDKLKFMAGC